MEYSNRVTPAMHTASPVYTRLARRSTAELEAMLVRGETPSLQSLVGCEYRGYNIAPMTALLGIRKFIKVFFTASDGAVFGCNTPTVQNGLRGPWVAKPSEDVPKRYAFFRVLPVDPTGRDNAYLHALLLDYGQGGNPFSDPSRFLRDYLVRCDAGSDDLLLGKAYTAIGPLRMPAGFFILERRRPVPGIVRLPRAAGHSI
jgi:hypothetical protein